MARKTFLRPLSAVLLFAAVPALAACGGRIISLGSSDTLKTISADTVTGAPGACPSGYVHPNICCSATSSSSTCGAWEANPLRACEPGDTTYPDPLSCCSLSDPKQCIDTPGDAGAVPTPPPSYGCGYTCPPGWWSQAPSITPGGPEGTSCCTVLANGVTECQAQDVAVPVSGPVYGGPVCVTNGGTTSAPSGGEDLDGGAPVDASIPVGFDAGPAPGTDGGWTTPADAGTSPIDAGTSPLDGGTWIDDGGCNVVDAGYPTPIENYDGGGASLCGACPAGWNAPSAQPELCCSTARDGTEQCFSQATGSVYGTFVPEDAGVSPPSGGTVSSPPSSGWGAGGANGASCSGSDTTCSCDHTLNGHTYALDCYVGSNGVPTCTCSVDGVSSGTASVSSCQDSTAVENGFSATTGCGFP